MTFSEAAHALLRGEIASAAALADRVLSLHGTGYSNSYLLSIYGGLQVAIHEAADTTAALLPLVDQALVLAPGYVTWHAVAATAARSAPRCGWPRPPAASFATVSMSAERCRHHRHLLPESPVKRRWHWARTDSSGSSRRTPAPGQDGVTRWDPNVPAQVGASYVIGNALADPSSVAVGADGALWVAETGADKLLRVTADGAGNLAGSEVQLAAGAQPLTIVAGPDNAMWFNQSGLSFNNIARIANGSNVAATIGGLTNLFGPRGMALGPDNNIWVSGFGANKIAKFGTAPAPVITTTTASIITTTTAPINTTTTGPIITTTTAVLQECVKTKAVVTKIGKKRVRRYICVAWKITTSH